MSFLKRGRNIADCRVRPLSGEYTRSISLGSKLIAFLVICGIIACTICVTGNMAFLPKSFTPRLSAPMKNNTCYFSSNIFNSSGYGMPNCTAYAWGRAYEILRKEPRLSLGNAGQWFEYNKENQIYDYGKEPKVGAIACFDNEDGGHVAVVEKIENGKVTFSNSAYMGEYFYLSYADVEEKNPGQDGWIFQGYIYLKDDFKEESANETCSVTAKGGLNFRTDAGLGTEIIDVIPEKEKITITTLHYLDGYIWGKTNYKGETGFCVVEYTDISLLSGI